MARKLKTLGLMVAVLIVLSGGLTAALAETEKARAERATPSAPTSVGPSGDIVITEKAAPETDSIVSGLFKPLLATVIFGIVGLVILLIGYRILDVATPFDMNKEISEGKNVAAGTLAAGMLIAVAIVVHAAMAL